VHLSRDRLLAELKGIDGRRERAQLFALGDRGDQAREFGHGGVGPIGGILEIGRDLEQIAELLVP